METPKPLFLNLFALLFSSMPQVNAWLQTLVLILSIIISIMQLRKMK